MSDRITADWIIVMAPGEIIKAAPVVDRARPVLGRDRVPVIVPMYYYYLTPEGGWQWPPPLPCPGHRFKYGVVPRYWAQRYHWHFQCMGPCGSQEVITIYAFQCVNCSRIECNRCRHPLMT